MKGFLLPHPLLLWNLSRHPWSTELGEAIQQDHSQAQDSQGSKPQWAKEQDPLDPVMLTKNQHLDAPSPSQSGEDLKPRHPSCWQQAQKLRGPGTQWGRLQKGRRRGLSKAKLLGYTTPDRWVDAHPLATCQIKGDFPIFSTFSHLFSLCTLSAEDIIVHAA